jgi:molecular chaperone GrpE
MMSEAEQYNQLETDTPLVDSEELNEDTESSTQEIVDNSSDDINQEQDEQTFSSSENESVEATSPEEVVTAQDDQSIISALEQEIASLKNELEAQKEQASSIHNQYMRLNADFENFRRRTTKEKKELEQQAKKKTIIELLSVVDNFERARNQIKPLNEGEMAIHKSYQGVYKTFVESLKKIGVSAMRPEGKLFDPNFHEAMLREPTNEYPEGTVIEELVRGYLLEEQVLRHAMVKVATEAEDEPMENSNNKITLEEQ